LASLIEPVTDVLRSRPAQVVTYRRLYERKQGSHATTDRHDCVVKQGIHEKDG
jgi:hypothetical protein